jgi:tetratricopeptide (TPR) repeat protein
LTRCRRVQLLAALVACALSGVASAQTAADAAVAPSHSAEAPAAAKAEARRRFDRGLALYNAGDLSGAYAEFRLAHRLTGHPVVLYNLALVHAGLGQAAEAVDALEKLLASSARAELGPERAERAEKVYEEQLLRVGALEIKSDVPRARIQIDSIDVAKTPAPPVRVTAGTHLVSLSAPEHEPRHVSVTVAGRAVEVIEVNLTPLEQALAHLTVKSQVPDISVRANGELIGRTPFASNVALRPGSYELEFDRPGYVPVRRKLELDPGSVGELEVPMVPSDAGLAAGGTLAFALSETDAVVSVDGQPRLDHTLGLKLPLGRHSVRISRAGFFDVDREIWVRPGRQAIDVTLLPTPEHLGDYVSDAKSQRFWSYLTLAGGAAVTAASAGFLLWNQGEKNEAEREFDQFAGEVAAYPNGTCDTDLCEQKLTILVDELDQRRSRDVFGWVGVGAGTIALGLGAFFLARSPDPDRYDPKPESDVFGSLDLRVRGSMLEAGGTFW